jgi:hypothetical protein
MPRRSERVAHRSLASAKNELPARRQDCDFFPLSQVHAAYTLSGFGPVQAKRESAWFDSFFLPMSSAFNASNRQNVAVYDSKATPPVLC